MRGKRLLTGLFVLLAGSFEAGAQPTPTAVPSPTPDCTLDPTGLQPHLLTTHKDFLIPVTRKREPRSLAELVTVRGLGSVKVSQGGCAHYGVTYEFSLVPDKTPATDRLHHSELALSLLKRPYFSPEGISLAGTVAEMLEKALGTFRKKGIKKEEQSGECSLSECVTSFSCGDAHCELNVKRADKRHVSIRILYDFPL